MRYLCDSTFQLNLATCTLGAATKQTGMVYLVIFYLFISFIFFVDKLDFIEFYLILCSFLFSC